ncbi:hypothetical protein [Microbulbifer spongiae]|uniref:DUF1674 domain-containing protein n=1 Tax=Microbulbifer spongiae TaxID=2944933 RepID=A0ABY9EFY2_9GAMM|nr:hypothetical protein [Microbulbifer sp. MI-G]WKD50524.1 hypothetical protein M8T91_03585 [Microbulbifer sp. MI-G]
MTDEKRPPKGTPEYEQWRKKRAKERAKELLSGAEEVDQTGLLSGGKETMRDDDSDGKPSLKVVK